METKYRLEYAAEIERLQKKGGQLTSDEVRVLDYCNDMLIKFPIEEP